MVQNTNSRTTRTLASLSLLAAAIAFAPKVVQAQEPAPEPAAVPNQAATAPTQPAAAPADLASERFDAAMNAPEPELTRPAPPTEQGLDLLEMASPTVGGIFMYPIYFFSFVVVLFGIERMFGLRRRKVLPRKLVRELNSMLSGTTGFDPRKVWRLCQRHPSAGANVIKAALLRTGKPMADLQDAVSKAEEREAARLYSNIRPLNLSATAAPLLGLVGTVQGMIMAFYATAHLPDGANKAQSLAEGVYVALVTTFAGLCVAIPAVCLAHYFEGKIQRLFGKLERLLDNLLPVLERYEGKMRITRGPIVAHAGNDPALASEPEYGTTASSE